MRPGTPSRHHRSLWGTRLAAVAALAMIGGACRGGSGEAIPTTSTSARAATTTSATALVTTTSASPTSTRTTTTISPGTVAPVTARATSTTARRPVTTRPWSPAEPQATPAGAAYALLDDWADGDRAGALEDASQAAVAALFSNPYSQQYGFDFRGCSTPPADLPVTCSVRVGEGNLLQLTATSFPEGWGITAAVIET